VTNPGEWFQTLPCPEYTLRRIPAALLVLFFGAGPLLPVLPALPVGRVQSDIPACCRKGGAHKCSVRIAKKSTEEQDGNPDLRAVCPFLSHAVPGIGGPQSFVPPSAAELGTAVVPIHTIDVCAPWVPYLDRKRTGFWLEHMPVKQADTIQSRAPAWVSSCPTLLESR
jgi:hypothetical protein